MILFNRLMSSAAVAALLCVVAGQLASTSAADPPLPKELKSLRDEAEKATQQGNLEQAIARTNAWLAATRRLPTTNELEVADALELLGRVQLDRGEFDAAKKSFDELLAIWQKRYGPDDWHVAEANFALKYVARLQKLSPDQWRDFTRARKLTVEAYHLADADKLDEAARAAADSATLYRRLLDQDDPRFYAWARYQQGVIDERLEQLATAIAHFQAALDIWRKTIPAGHPTLAVALWSLANPLIAERDFARAEPLVVEALDIATRARGPDHDDVVDALNVQASLCKARGDFAAAQPIYERVLEIRRRTKGRDSREYAITLGHLGYVLQNLEDFAAAEKLYAEALEIETMVLAADDPDRAYALNNMGIICRYLGDFARAEQYSRAALELRERTLGPAHSQTIVSANNLGNLYRDMGNYAAARKLLTDALQAAIERHGEDHLDTALVQHNLSMVLREMQIYDEAEQLTRAAVATRGKLLGEQHPLYGASLENLGNLLAEQGNFAAALPLVEQASQIYRTSLGADSARYANSLNNLAMLFQDLGDYVRARQLMQQAVDIYRQVLGDEHPDYASGLSNLAMLNSRLGEHELAVKQMQAALRIREKTLDPAHPDLGTTLNNLASLYHDQGQVAEAEQYYRRALDNRRRVFGPNDEGCAHSLHNLAQLYQETRQYARAERCVRECLAIYDRTRGENSPGYTTTLYTLASLYQLTERPVEARQTMVRGFTLDQRQLRSVLGFRSEQEARHFHEAWMTGVLDTLVTMAAANQVTDPAIVETTFTWLLRRKAIVLENLCRYRQAERLLAQDEIAGRDAEHLRELRQQLANLPLQAPADVDPNKLRQSEKQLMADIAALEGTLNRRLAELWPDTTTDTADLAAIRSRLPARTALVELVRIDPFRFDTGVAENVWLPARYYAFVLPADGKSPVQLIDLGLASEIDAAVHAVRHSIAEAGTSRAAASTEAELEAEYRAVAQQLWKRVYQPLERALAGAEDVYLSTDGELNLLPFEALVDAENKYLVERVRFAYLTSGRDLLRALPANQAGTVVFAGPDYDLSLDERTRVLAEAAPPHDPQPPAALAARGATSEELRAFGRWRKLPGAAQEARDIRAALAESQFAPVTIYEGSTALEETLKSLHRPHILHIATHGFFFADDHRDPAAAAEADRGTPGGAARLARLRASHNPLLRSGLVLAGANTLLDEATQPGEVEDGWITAEEIALLDLVGTDLVVLSACESGVGETTVGDGVLGLRRAFQAAGVKSLVTSLFKVPDLETRELMRTFYKSLEQGHGKLASLHAAQLAMIQERRKNHKAAHPFYWASFVLYGAKE